MKDAIPPSRKITKTDLAKYIMAWSVQPDVVSLGSQKCFDRFMGGMTVPEGETPPPAPDVASYKAMVASAIVFKAVQKMVRPMFQAFQANVAAYTVSLLSNRLGSRFDLTRVWDRQVVSPQLLAQLGVWAGEVNDVLHRTAGGRMVSEWAKKPECREAVIGATFSEPAPGIPEIR